MQIGGARIKQKDLLNESLVMLQALSTKVTNIYKIIIIQKKTNNCITYSIIFRKLF